MGRSVQYPRKHGNSASQPTKQNGLLQRLVFVAGSIQVAQRVFDRFDVPIDQASPEKGHRIADEQRQVEMVLVVRKKYPGQPQHERNALQRNVDDLERPPGQRRFRQHKRVDRPSVEAGSKHRVRPARPCGSAIPRALVRTQQGEDQRDDNGHPADAVAEDLLEVHALFGGFSLHRFYQFLLVVFVHGVVIIVAVVVVVSIRVC
mmetsp:Transcript_27111/g.58036  ORF Transcript_27111/g.58036 Transcript_27111/m.58036 type:complete len:204 (-) Transcript_27111:238-849(-)